MGRDSRIAEAEATSQSAVKQAENERITALRRLDKELAVATANAEKRKKDALTRRTALVAEVQAKVGAELARAKAEAATIVEEGRSQAEGLQDLVESLKRS